MYLGYAEKCFNLLKSNSGKSSKNERFEVRLMLINLISRLIGVHKLLLLDIYPYYQKYIEPKQQSRKDT
jgi:protein SDA1